jgi:hypothetical protein
MASASPPPLKRRPAGDASPPPRKKGRSAGLDRIDLPDEISMPSMAAPGPVDDDPTAGEWLFKEKDTIRGPVPAKVLIDGINDGLLGADALIAREVGKWKPLGDVSLFKEALDASIERKRIEEELKSERARRRRQNIVRFVLVLVFVVGPFAAGVVGGRILMEKRPWDDTREWASRMPPLIDLPPKARPIVAVKPDPPPVEPAVDDADSKDDVDEPNDGDGKPEGKGGKGKGGKGKKPKDTKGKDDKKPDAKDDAKADTAAAPSGAMVATLSEDQVKDGLLKGFNGFKGCIKAEIEKKTELPARITLAFSIANDGRAIEAKLLERQVRTGPLNDCIKGVVSGLRWPKFYGERRYVEFPFNIGPKK